MKISLPNTCWICLFVGIMTVMPIPGYGFSAPAGSAFPQAGEDSGTETPPKPSPPVPRPPQ